MCYNYFVDYIFINNENTLKKKICIQKIIFYKCALDSLRDLIRHNEFVESVIIRKCCYYLDCVDDIYFSDTVSEI